MLLKEPVSGGAAKISRAFLFFFFPLNLLSADQAGGPRSCFALDKAASFSSAAESSSFLRPLGPVVSGIRPCPSS